MKKILTTPIKAEDLQDIRVGDVIYLTGDAGDLPRRLSPPFDRTETSDPLRSQRQSDFPRWPHRAQKRRQMGDGLRRPDNQYAYGKF